MKTTTQVKMWGNSLAIRIPSRVARDLGLTNDSQVEITSDGKMATLKRTASNLSPIPHAAATMRVLLVIQKRSL
jgi:antitoxin component of MazEF toxin-antitoxin module